MHGLDTQLRLLLATDLSERSDRAFDRALMLARENRAHLIVLSVIDEALPKPITERLSKQTHDFIEEHIAAAKIRGQAEVQIRIARGRDYKTIIDQARDGNVHLVILGTHRSDALIDTFVGATMDRVLRYGDRSVLVVKNKPRRAYQNILVGTDFSEMSSHALEYAIRLFPEAKFTLLHAHARPVAKSLRQDREFAKLWERRRANLTRMIERTLKRMREELGCTELALLPALEEGMALLAMIRHIETNKHDLLVVGTHGRSGWRKALLGSVTQAALSRAPSDVLAVRHAQED
ncbi:MAG: universal stress protein [Hyphomicrobiaceae bacterium]